MKKVLISIILTALLINTGCNINENKNYSSYSKYTYEFFGSFDTIIQFIGYSENEKQFEEMAKKAQARFEELHKLFDTYNNYDGVNNVKTINDNAGEKPVKVEQEIIDIIQFSKKWYKETEGAVNIALGAVLVIWHQYREEGLHDIENARLPDIDLLRKAQLKTDINKVEVDLINNSVYLSEKGMSLDLGAVAKGFVTEIVANEMENEGYESFLISSGGNVRAVGQPFNGSRSKWGIGIQDTSGNELISNRDILDIAYVTDTSVVTSGDYQKYYIVNGERVHHLIDPTTLMPANHYRAVTVMTKDSGLADFLSTTVFLLPCEKSYSIVKNMEGVEALWVMQDGSIKATEGMKKSLKEMGGATNK